MPILLPNERSSLEEKVGKFVYSTPENIFAILREHSLFITPVKPPIKFAEEIIIFCEQSGWTEEPALLVRLMEFWQDYPDISEAIKRIKPLQPPIFFTPGLPWETTCHVALELPFIGREITRRAAALFLQPLLDRNGYPLGKRVLIINGPEGSGKTYTNKYLEYISSVYEDQRFKTVYIDYTSYISSRFGPKELAESIMFKINPEWDISSLPTLGNEQPARWRLQLAKFLAKQIRQNRNRCFIILDKFNSRNTPIPDGTIELIQLLARVAAGSLYEEEAKDTVRLVLLDFIDSIQDYEERIDVENINPLSKDDIRKYFRNYIAFKRINIDYNNASIIDYLVDKALQKDPGDVPGRSKLLAMGALNIALELEKPIKN